MTHSISVKPPVAARRRRSDIVEADDRGAGPAGLSHPASRTTRSSTAACSRRSRPGWTPVPFNAVVTGIFVLAILHTFLAARFSALAHKVQHRHDERRHRQGLGRQPSLAAELLHFVGEVEVVFGLWAIVLLVAIVGAPGHGRRHALLQRHGQLHRADVCRGDHGAGLDAARRRVCRGCAGPRGRPRARHAGGVVAVDPDHRAGARVVHHRTGGDDHLRAAAGRASSTTCSPQRA